MVRTCSVDEKGLKKGTWTEEEDRKLKAYIEKYGHWNWRQLPKFAGVARCGKSCRLRWMNYLRPGLKRGNYTKEEEDLIIQLHEKHGNKWSAIAAKLPGRTDNEIKNYWHTNLKRRFKPSQPTKDICISNPNITGLSTVQSQNSHHHHPDHQSPPAISSQVEIFAAETSSPSSSSSSSYSSSTKTTTESSRTSLNSNGMSADEISSFAESIESFWSEPFILDTSYNYYNDQNFQDSSSVLLFDVEERFVSFSSSSYLDDDGGIDDFGLPLH